MLFRLLDSQEKGNRLSNEKEELKREQQASIVRFVVLNENDGIEKRHLAQQDSGSEGAKQRD
jgi:hypothetical protein